MASIALNLPVTGMERTPAGDGYWEVATDGGIFSFGSATFHDHAIYTGSDSPGGTAAQLAAQLLASSSTFSSVHVSGVRDNANAHQNLVDTAAGKRAARLCYGTAPCGTVALSPTMLQALLEITKANVVRVSEIAGGSHSSSSSLHYQGTAFDIDLINGSGGKGNSMSPLGSRPRDCHLQGLAVLGNSGWRPVLAQSPPEARRVTTCTAGGKPSATPSAEPAAAGFVDGVARPVPQLAHWL